MPHHGAAFIQGRRLLIFVLLNARVVFNRVNMLSVSFFSCMYDKGKREDENKSRDVGQEASLQINF